MAVCMTTKLCPSGSWSFAWRSPMGIGPPMLKIVIGWPTILASATVFCNWRVIWSTAPAPAFQGIVILIGFSGHSANAGTANSPAINPAQIAVIEILMVTSESLANDVPVVGVYRSGQRMHRRHSKEK